VFFVTKNKHPINTITNMNILKNINVVRRSLMQGMTKKISGSSMNENLPMIDRTPSRLC
jgi:hypothetical protein